MSTAHSEVSARFRELVQIKHQIDELREKVLTSSIPTIHDNMQMKKLIAELYKKLGHDNDDAWFCTYLECGDIAGLRAHMEQPHIRNKVMLAHQEGNSFLPAEPKKKDRGSP